MSWVESPDEPHVGRNVLAGLLLIAIAGVALGYAAGLLLTEGFDVLPLEDWSRWFAGQDAAVPTADGNLTP